MKPSRMLPWMMLPMLAAGAPREAVKAAPVPAIHWQFGPRTLTLAGMGGLSLPRGIVSADRAESRRFLEAAGNPPAGDELAVVAPSSLDWFLVFSFEPYRKLGLSQPEPTVEEIVAALKRGNWEANAARRQAGRETLDQLAWRDKPRYDAKTARLEWSLDSAASGGRTDASRFWLFLTRSGVLMVELVGEPARFAAASRQARALLDHLGIVEQEAYSDPNSHDWLSVTLGIIAAVLPAVGFLVLFLLQRRKKWGRPPAPAHDPSAH